METSEGEERWEKGVSDEGDMSKVQHAHIYENITTNPITFYVNYKLSKRAFIRIQSVADSLPSPSLPPSLCTQEDFCKGERSTWKQRDTI